MEITVKERSVNGAIRHVVDLRSIHQGRKFFDSKEQAEAELNRLQLQTADGVNRFDAVPPRHKLELMLAYERADKSGSTVLKAVDYYAKHVAPLQPILLTNAVTEFIRVKLDSGKRERYVNELRLTLESFSRFMQTINCSEISREHVEKWIADNQWSNRTKAGKLIDLGTFFSFAQNRKWIAENPVKLIEKIRFEQKPPCILTVEEARRLMNSCRRLEPEFLAYLTLAMFCGIRPAEIMRLEAMDVDFASGLVRIDGSVSKTRHKRFVTIQPNARKWLLLATPDSSMDLTESLPPKNWQGKLEKVREDAQIEWGHDILRHTFCSYAGPILGWTKTAMEAGHSESVLMKHYRELVKPDDAKAFWEIVP